MSKIIIAIHGLGNKPPLGLLEKWWKRSLHDGLKLIGRPHENFNFYMTYWADTLHSEPLDPTETDPNRELFLDETYTEPNFPQVQKKKKLRRKIFDYLRNSFDKLLFKEIMDLNVESITHSFVHYYFRDLEIYYSDKYLENTDPPRFPKDVIRERLVNALKKYDSKKICLIAHSMGSIIAYDVLMKEVPGINIDTFITIGSPLGQPPVLSKIKSEHNIPQEEKLRMPDNISTAWYNLFDHDDQVAIVNNLSKNFSSNRNKITIQDLVVRNGYSNLSGTKNPHKSYGYLRTPEVALIIHEFLSVDESKLAKWIKKSIGKFTGRFFYDK